jgi:DNA-binding transcriptional MerR regulator
MRRDFSVTELAKLVADQFLGDDVQTVQRQLQHWTERGILKTEGDLFVGRGGSRRYSLEAAYLASILVRLAAYGIPIAVLKMLTEGFETKLSEDPAAHALWEEAIAGTKRVHFGFWFVGSANAVHQLTFVVTDGPISQEDLIVPAIWLNVTHRFSRVRAALGRANG